MQASPQYGRGFSQRVSVPADSILKRTNLPASEYLTAFVSKFVKTCRSKRSSASISTGISPGRSGNLTHHRR